MSTSGTQGLCRRLLLVEDDSALRQMLDWELADRGYDMVTAASCEEARYAMATTPCGYALIDQNLPDGRGTEIAAELIGQDESSRVILISGAHGAVGKVGDGLLNKVLAFLTKPVDAGIIDRLFSNEEDRLQHAQFGIRRKTTAPGA